MTTKDEFAPPPKWWPMFGVYLWLAGWRWAADTAPCVAAAVFLLGIWALLLAAGYEWALLRRVGFVNHYLEPGGTLAHVLRRRTLLFLWNAVKNLPAALVLFIATLSLSIHHWLVLAADILVAGTVLALSERVLDREAAPAYARPLARIWTHRINALLLWAALIAVTYYSPHQDFRGLTWELASRTAAAEVQAQCDVVGALSRADAVREALQWWAAQNFLGGLTDAGELMAAWLAFLAAFGVSFFVAWGFSRALMGALARPWQIGATPGQRAGSYRSG